jgi:hypothetical protein
MLTSCWISRASLWGLRDGCMAKSSWVDEGHLTVDQEVLENIFSFPDELLRDALQNPMIRAYRDGCELRTLPQILKFHLGNRKVRPRAQAILSLAQHHALLLERLGVWQEELESAVRYGHVTNYELRTTAKFVIRN